MQEGYSALLKIVAISEGKKLTVNIRIIYLKSWGTDAFSSHTVTVSTILAAADLLTRFTIESRGTCLITVESRPARLAGALSRHRVTAGRRG